MVTARARIIVASAGRRIDAADGPRRFPSDHESLVADRLRDLYEQRGVTQLVSSAACGADLLGLEIAGDLGIRRVVVLPHDAVTFRRQSVVDRGVAWGPRFDRVIRELEDPGDLRVIKSTADGDAIYREVNERVLAIALQSVSASGGRLRPMAVVVWEGHSRGDDDLTEHFKRTAEAKGLRVVQISTL
jgi:hypothetical protein